MTLKTRLCGMLVGMIFTWRGGIWLGHMLKDAYHHSLIDQKSFVPLTKLNDVCLHQLRNVWIECSVAEFHCSVSESKSLSPKCCTLSKSNAPGRWDTLCRSVVHICRNGSGHVEIGSDDSKPMSRWLNQWLYTFSHCESAPSQLNAAWGNSFRQLHSNFDNLLALRQISLE